MVSEGITTFAQFPTGTTTARFSFDLGLASKDCDVSCCDDERCGFVEMPTAARRMALNLSTADCSCFVDCGEFFKTFSRGVAHEIRGTPSDYNILRHIGARPTT